MTNVRMKARDTLHVSSVRAESLSPDEEFEVPGYLADDLEARGLADRIAEPAEEKAEPAPQNKAEGAAPANKAATGRKPKKA